MTTYSYDGLQRLSGAHEANGPTYAYGYDLAGNRTGVTINGVTVSRSYNAANQVVGWQYDAAGNLVHDDTTTYTYDALNRLTQQNGTAYAYNGDGVLMTQTTGGVATRYTQDIVAPLSQVLQTVQGGSAPTSYLYGHERFAAVANGTRTWYTGDALGSVRLTLNDTGMGTGAYRYDPWGAPRQALDTPFGYTGELQGTNATLTYLRARWYQGRAGVFINRDTFEGYVGLPYTLHQYQYAE